MSCGGCGLPVNDAGPNSNSHGFIALGRTWHKDCFKCGQCGGKLFSFAKFFEKDGKVVCASCAFPKCAGCSQQIKTTYTVAHGLNFHDECFKCAVCEVPLKDADGHWEDKGKVYHLKCKH